jgi:long-chain acyl-CoA synthetase
LRRELGIAEDVGAAAVAARNDVLEFVRREVAGCTADLATFEQIRRIALLPRELTIEDGELSPTLKVKRRVVERKFAALIESAYAPEPARA